MLDDRDLEALSVLKMIALTGSLSVEVGPGSFRCTSQYEPGSSSPLRVVDVDFGEQRARRRRRSTATFAPAAPVNRRPGNSFSVRSAWSAGLRVRASRPPGTLTNTRSRRVSAMWNSSRAVLPESMSAPTSMFRAVIITANGASMRVNACSCSRRITLACADCDRRLPGFEGAVRVVEVLPRHRFGLDQVAVAIGRRLRQPRVGLSVASVGARLQQLLLDFGRVDFGEQLTGAHVRRRCLRTSCSGSRWFSRRSARRRTPASCPAG